MSLHTYYCRERPPAPGSIPREGLYEVNVYPHPTYDSMDGHMIYGYVNYTRKLTKEEIEQYELLPQEEG